MFYFDEKELMAIADQKQKSYQNANPFPHTVIDNFLPPQCLDEVLEEFPNPNAIEWSEFKNAREKKLATKAYTQMGTHTKHLLSQFNSAPMCEFLERLTGIPDIIPDPYFVGGGLHQIVKGGFLKVHADFNWHAKLQLYRRINVLLYLNKDWKEEYGGHLELWDTNMQACRQQVLPIFNRCVVFTTTSDSYHGHPNPLTCPEDASRKSIALYYYTKNAPQDAPSKLHDTIFRSTPGHTLPKQKANVKSIIKKCIPPILIDIKNALFKNRDQD